MKEKIIYIVSVITAFFVGIIATIVTIKYIPTPVNQTPTDVKQVSITETNTIKEAVDKIYDAVILVESYNKNTLIGTGTGFVYKKDDNNGYIITNHHVIDKADAVKIINNNGESVDAKILGSDEYADIAVLSIDSKAVMAVAEIGASETLEIGDTLFTVGSPLGSDYMGTVTKGILSGKNRAVEVDLSNGTFMMEVLQTDAAINPGNSGGPLVNINGEVIGVNSLKLVEDEIEGMGFAIPIELVMSSVDRLEKGETINRPYLGIESLETTNLYALYRNHITLPKDYESGIVIVNVEKDSPAAKAGLQSGDVVLAINDSEIKNMAYFRFVLYKYSVGDEVTFKIERNGKAMDIKVKLSESLENS